MVRDAYPFLFPLVLLALVCALIGLRAPALVLLAAACFVGFFFRNPMRPIPPGDHLILSPADGKVVRIVPLAGQEGAGIGHRISIFLSIFDVHVNRSPVRGTLEALEYRRGKFKAAFRHEASLVNEQNILTISRGGSKLIVHQIAGILARRVVCWRKPGENLEKGEVFGLIRFGSRVDVMLPSGVRIVAKEGDRVKGGVTVLGEYL